MSINAIPGGASTAAPLKCRPESVDWTRWVVADNGPASGPNVFADHDGVDPRDRIGKFGNRAPADPAGRLRVDLARRLRSAQRLA